MGRPRSRGTSSSTPRPTSPSLSTSIVSAVAPAEVTESPGAAVVEGPVERDVAERVDVAVAVVVVVDADVVLGEAQRPGSDVGVARASSCGDPPARDCRSRSGVQRQAQRHGLAAANEPGGRDDPVGRELVERARSSSSPQRPQSETASNSPLNSAALISTLAMALLAGVVPPLIWPPEVLDKDGSSACCPS